jgi:hypothetical protein
LFQRGLANAMRAGESQLKRNAGLAFLNWSSGQASTHRLASGTKHKVGP